LHNAYVIKPVRINSLLDHIGRLLNLVWCYEKQELITKTQVIGALELPTDEHLDDIAQLASIGHKKGLQEKIQQLEQSGAAHPAFIVELTKLTSNFQFEKILSLIDVEPDDIERSTKLNTKATAETIQDH
jgi:hypothetical protein